MTLLQKKPVVYQEIAGARVAREGKFKLQRNVAGHNYGFEMAAYDRNRPLVIDPVLVFSTYLGSGNDDFCYGIALDPQGNILLTGATGAAFFPTKNALYPVGQGASDAFVTKMKGDGSALIFSTYLGGKYDESGLGIGADGQGNIYVTGWTSSTNFPVKNALYPTKNGFPLDIFMTKIKSDGSELLYSTFLGGTGMDYPYGIAVDLDGHACVTGHTQSTDFPVKNALYPSPPAEGNAFVTKFKPDGSDLAFSTFLGKGGNETGYGIAVDSAGNIYVTGQTDSQVFPLKNPLFSIRQGARDAFVSKIGANGNGWYYSTYLGGWNWTRGHAIAADAAGNAYITGSTGSTDFPVKNALFPTSKGNAEAFIVKIGSGQAPIGVLQLLLID